jgi:hypothetical protein
MEHELNLKNLPLDTKLWAAKFGKLHLVAK